MSTIFNAADFLRLLREDPDFRDEARSLLLTQDLIELPERFARFEAYVERRFRSIDGDLGRLKGAEYERRVGKSFASYASRAFGESHDRSLRQSRLLYSNILGRDSGFEELIANAVDGGLITNDERAELEQADAVMSGQYEGNAVYFVGEFSITINHTDIDRAIARAATLNKATGCDARPMVIGDTIPEPQRVRAEAEQVAFRVIED